MSDLKIKETKNGKGVFATRDFIPGETIIEFTGKHLNDREVPDDYGSIEDHYNQIGPNEYLGPSGSEDDYINHSCNPNSGLIFNPDGRIFLKCIRLIKAGEEITWDYSTTMNEWGIIAFGDWEMDCRCGESNCRKKIKDFKFIPKDIQDRYINLGIVPDYIKNAKKDKNQTIR